MLRFHRHDVPSAGTRSGMAWRRAPNTHVGQHLADHVARGDGPRRQGVDDAARGRGHRQRRQAARVVRHLRAERAGQAEHSVGRGVGQRHVDAALGCGGWCRHSRRGRLPPRPSPRPRASPARRSRPPSSRCARSPWEGRPPRAAPPRASGSGRARPARRGRRARTPPSSPRAGGSRRRCTRRASRRRLRCPRAGACWRGSSPSASRRARRRGRAAAAGCRAPPSARRWASGPKPIPPISIRWLVQENKRDQAALVEARRRQHEVVEVPGAHPGDRW